MKKVRFISVAAFVVAVVTLSVLNSCGKQEIGGQALNSKTGGQSQMTMDDHSVINRIMNFKQKAKYLKENPGYKSGESMSVDSAKWYLDAVFNYSYAYTEESFDSFNSGTFMLTLTKINGRIDFEDICDAFNELREQTLLIYYNTDGDEKELYVSHMEITNDTDDEVTVTVTATIGSDTNETLPPTFVQWGPFIDDDDWMYGERMGDCFGNYEDEKDAATEICWATNFYRSKYIQDEGTGWYAYYTEPSAIGEATVYNSLQNQILFRNPNDATIDNDRDYLLLYQKKDNLNGLEIETCIPWEDMNFYYHGTRKVIYEIIQDNYSVFGVSDLLTFYSCEIEGIGVGDNNDPDFAYHVVSPLYKTRHISVIDERTSIGDDQ